jgi:26S proteasome regulatory subunit N8
MCYVLSSGVEHLLWDVKDTTISTLATEVMFHERTFNIHAALKGLGARLREIQSYFDLVIEGKLLLNHEILYHLQVGLSVAYAMSYIC